MPAQFKPTGSPLERAREAARLTVNEAALAVTRDPQTVRRWEQGRFRPSRAVLVRLAALYGTDVQTLAGA